MAERRMIFCHTTGEIAHSYNAYLKTDHWLNKRYVYLKCSSYTCSGCCKNLAGKTFHLHHKNYKNVGNESYLDLSVLCPECHFKIHHGVKTPMDMLVEEMVATCTDSNIDLPFEWSWGNCR